MLISSFFNQLMFIVLYVYAHTSLSNTQSNNVVGLNNCAGLELSAGES